MYISLPLFCLYYFRAGGRKVDTELLRTSLSSPSSLFRGVVRIQFFESSEDSYYVKDNIDLF